MTQRHAALWKGFKALFDTCAESQITGNCTLVDPESSTIDNHCSWQTFHRRQSLPMINQKTFSLFMVLIAIQIAHLRGEVLYSNCVWGWKVADRLIFTSNSSKFVSRRRGRNYISRRISRFAKTVFDAFRVATKMLRSFEVSFHFQAAALNLLRKRARFTSWKLPQHPMSLRLKLYIFCSRFRDTNKLGYGSLTEFSEVLKIILECELDRFDESVTAAAQLDNYYLSKVLKCSEWALQIMLLKTKLKSNTYFQIEAI